MKGSYRIATVAGIEVRVHFTFLLLLAFYAFNDYTHDGVKAAVSGATFLLTLFLCVLLHEFGHAFAARAFGIRTPDITLLPIGGVARLERMPASPWQELVIALAGPAVNVVIAAVIAAVIALRLGGIPDLRDLALLEKTGSGLLLNLFFVNALLIAFNLIPAFPMDGGRVLRALMATQMRHATATLIAARVGQVIAVLFVGAAIMTGNYMLIFIAMFVFLGAQQELAYARLRETALDVRVGQAMITHFQTLPVGLRAGEVPALLSGNEQGVFPLVDDSLHLRGLATRDELLQATRELPPQSPANCVARQIPFVHPETALDEALELMQRLAEPILAVVNASGQIVGLVSQAHLAELSRLRDA